MLSVHIKQEIFLTFQTGSCLLLYEGSAESFCSSMSFLHYFHSAINNHLSIAISMSPELIVKEGLNYNKYHCDCLEQARIFKTFEKYIQVKNKRMLENLCKKMLKPLMIIY